MSSRGVRTVGSIVARTQKQVREGSVSTPLGDKRNISSDTNVLDNSNAVLYGPITIDADVSLKIGNNSEVIILNLDDANPVEIPEVRLGGDTIVNVDGTMRVIDQSDSKVENDTVISNYDTVLYDPVEIGPDAFLKIGKDASLTISQFSKIDKILPPPEIQIGGDSIVSIDGALRVIDRNDSIIRADSIVQKHDIDTVLYGPVTIDSGRYLKIAEDAELNITTMNDVGGLYSSLGNPTSVNTTILDNYNAILFGPITVDAGDSFKIGNGSAAKIVNISDAFSAIKYN